MPITHNDHNHTTNPPAMGLARVEGSTAVVPAALSSNNGSKPAPTEAAVGEVRERGRQGGREECMESALFFLLSSLFKPFSPLLLSTIPEQRPKTNG